MKKFFIKLFLISIILFYILSSFSTLLASTSTNEPETYSKYIVCIERTTSQVLYEKDAYTKTPMASTTKIMTAIIALENCELTEQVEVSSDAANVSGSTLGLTAESTVSMEALLYGLLICSGNDCAVAIAEYIGGSIEGFADLMNDKATNLGLVNTHFVTPHGLDDDNHYTTAYDLAILTNYALDNEKFKEIVGIKTTTIMVGEYSRTITNTNEVLGNTEGVYGVKTGFTANAGRCLVTACKIDNLDIIIVVLGADTKEIRGLDTNNIIEYIYSNFEMVDTYETIINAFEKFKENQNITVTKSLSEPEISLADNFTYTYPINKNEVQNLKTSIYTVTRIKCRHFTKF